MYSLQTLMSVRVITAAVRSAQTPQDLTTATVSVGFNWWGPQNVKVIKLPLVAVCGCVDRLRSSWSFIVLSDVDECILLPNGFCNQICVNTDGSYHCDCRDGYRLHGTSLCHGYCNNILFKHYMTDTVCQQCSLFRGYT